MKQYIYLLTISVFILSGCKPHTLREMPPAELMEHLLKTNPDSLAGILEDEIDPFLLPDSQRADYGRWITKTHSWQGRSLIYDTLILYSLDYYKKTGSPYLLETYQLASRQSNPLGNDNRDQINLLEEALQVAISQNDTFHIREITYFLTDQYSSSRDMEKLRSLLPLVKKYGGNPLNLFALNNLVFIYRSVGDTDSLVYYGTIGVGLPVTENDHRILYQLTRVYVEGLNEKGRSREALKILEELEKKVRTGDEIKLNYISSWMGLSRFDMVKTNLDTIQNMIDRYQYVAYEEKNVIDNVLQSMRAISNVKQGGNFSLNQLGESPDNILSYSRQLLKANRERQRVQTRLLEDNYSLEIERAGLRLRLVFAVFFLLILIAGIILVYQRKLLKKQRSVQLAKEQLRLSTVQLARNESIITQNEELIRTLSSQVDEGGELKDEIDQLSRENEMLRQKNGHLEHDMEQYTRSVREKDREIESFETLTRQNARLQERESFLSAQLVSVTEPLASLSKKPRYMDEMQWPGIVHAVNQLYDGLSYRLHTDFPSLTDEDIRYCCLIKIRFSNPVIATIMGISPSSVTKRKQRIKEKMVQQRPDEINKDHPLEIFLWNY